jgi:26S proteasome regulatory subunit N2
VKTSLGPNVPYIVYTNLETTDSDQPLNETNDRAEVHELSNEFVSDKQLEIFKSISTILDGSKTIQLNLEFLYRNNHTGAIRLSS